jgi:hypothetical protein
MRVRLYRQRQRHRPRPRARAADRPQALPRLLALTLLPPLIRGALAAVSFGQSSRASTTAPSAAYGGRIRIDGWTRDLGYYPTADAAAKAYREAAREAGIIIDTN